MEQPRTFTLHGGDGRKIAHGIIDNMLETVVGFMQFSLIWKRM